MHKNHQNQQVFPLHPSSRAAMQFGGVLPHHLRGYHVELDDLNYLTVKLVRSYTLYIVSLLKMDDEKRLPEEMVNEQATTKNAKDAPCI